MRGFMARELVHDPDRVPADAVRHTIADTREGWAKAVEILEGMAFRRERDRTLLIDLSHVRPLGVPIQGMQGRPASGPLSLLRAFINLRLDVIEAVVLRETLLRHRWNKTRAAAELGLSRVGLRAKLQRFGLDKP